MTAENIVGDVQQLVSDVEPITLEAVHALALETHQRVGEIHAAITSIQQLAEQVPQLLGGGGIGSLLGGSGPMGSILGSLMKSQSRR